VILVMDRDDIGRSIRRIAHEILENTDDAHDVVLLGIPRRGVPIANRLHAVLGDLGTEVPLGVLDPAPFRDDVAPGDRPANDTTAVPFPVAGNTAILVEDVLYTGRTIRAALDALMTLGRPARVQVVALVDRGHRELPIRADYVGKNLPTSRDQRVAVRLDECDTAEGVWIEAAAGRGGESR